MSKTNIPAGYTTQIIAEQVTGCTNGMCTDHGSDKGAWTLTVDGRILCLTCCCAEGSGETAEIIPSAAQVAQWDALAAAGIGR